MIIILVANNDALLYTQTQPIQVLSLPPFGVPANCRVAGSLDASLDLYCNVPLVEKGQVLGANPGRQEIVQSSVYACILTLDRY